MEKALKTSPESVIAEPFLFNLCTCRLSLHLDILNDCLVSHIVRAAFCNCNREQAQPAHRGGEMEWGCVGCFFYLRFLFTPVSKMD